MLISRRRPGGWVDVDKGLLVYLGLDNNVHVELGGNALKIALPPGEAPCLYLRCAIARTGAYALICQGQSGAALVSMSGGPFLSIGPCGGQNAVEVYTTDKDFVFLRQTSATSATRRFLNFLTGELREEVFNIPHTSQGFWDGELLTDQIRASVPGMILPTTVNGLTVGQHPVDNAVSARFNGVQGTLVKGLASEPHMTWLETDKMWRIVTRSDRGEFIDILTSEPIPIEVPQPSVDPWPPGKGWTLRTDIKEVDVVSYLLGGNWSRNGLHLTGDQIVDTHTYTHQFQSRYGDGWVQHTKFGPPDTRAATWTFTDKWVGLAYDGTNELKSGYRFVLPGSLETAALYPRKMRVGKQYAQTTSVELLDLETGSRRPMKFSGWVEAVYDGPKVGDIEPTTHALIGFEPAPEIPDKGWRELNICAFDQGCWYWHQEKKATGIVDLRWVGTKNSSRVLDPTVYYKDFLPLTEEKPTVSVKSREQFFKEFTEVNDFYAAEDGLQRPGGMVIDGVCDVVAMRQWGYDLVTGTTVGAIKAAIRQSKEWKQKHSGEVPDPDPR